MFRQLRFSVAIAAILVSPAAPRLNAQRAGEGKSRKVVFVCEHGTVKSVVALEHFNRLARARGLDIEAISRGTRPDSKIPSPVRRGLGDDGFDVSLFRPRPLNAGDLPSAVLIVSLDADVHSIVGKRVPVVKWDGLPSVTANYPSGRSAIVALVEKLVDSLARARSAGRP